MTKLNPAASAYADKLRVRVCGIYIHEEKLLLVRHGHTMNNSCFWAPPGGGLDYGETMQQCLQREFLEETGLEVEVKRFLFVNEFLQQPLHAVEMFFEVELKGGNLITGTDPESEPDQQLIQHVAFLALDEINQVPLQDKHRVLHHLFSIDDLLGMPHHFL
ncbi:NUDIX domain-containing protein [Pontibacter harenae]|uniref:NUDIX domain-containing protein n=1 Tax=Pontibacter harenae TaxID=2894083 RepID=UPI001E63387D|nr:NUDIX hydrolase [Pontibacter harenae]MCC9165576.1 NUDIX hydrolase [Pontibacter harenae]